MKLTDEQIEQMALDKYPIDGRMSTLAKRFAFKKGAKKARTIYEKEIQRLNLEILTMTGTIDELMDELKRLK